MSLEESKTLSLDFHKLNAVADVIPVAVQDAHSGEVILIAYTNEDALREAIATRKLVLWSTSRGRLWHKGAEESGNGFKLLEIRVNCEQNSLVYLVEQEHGGICHTKDAAGQNRASCYYRRINFDTGELEF
jgi:phosphoribosyl-AMP cyclohydrolase